MSTSINFVIFKLKQGNNGLLLKQFQLDEDNEPMYINSNVPYQTIDFLTRQLNDILNAAANHNITIALSHFLEQTFNLLESFNGGNEINHDKLTVMVVGDDFNLNVDPLTISNEFNRRGITLVVVAAVPLANEISKFYDILASNTGGHYMLLPNTESIFRSVIPSVLAGEDTLHEAFLRVRACEIEEKLAIN